MVRTHNHCRPVMHLYFTLAFDVAGEGAGVVIRAVSLHSQPLAGFVPKVAAAAAAAAEGTKQEKGNDLHA